jgi:hypothetical protein
VEWLSDRKKVVRAMRRRKLSSENSFVFKDIQICIQNKSYGKEKIIMTRKYQRISAWRN